MSVNNQLWISKSYFTLNVLHRIMDGKASNDAPPGAKVSVADTSSIQHGYLLYHMYVRERIRVRVRVRTCVQLKHTQIYPSMTTKTIAHTS